MKDAARRYAEVRCELNLPFEEWDPIGVYDDDEGPGRGEYDCLAEVTLAGLTAGASGASLVGLIGAEIAHHFGLPGVAMNSDLIAQIERRWLASGLSTSDG